MNEYLTAEQNAGIENDINMTAEQILDRDEKDTDTQALVSEAEEAEFEKELAEIEAMPNEVEETVEDTVEDTVEGA